MACLRLKSEFGIRIVAEGPDGNVRKRPDEVIDKVIWECGPQFLGDNMDYEAIFTRDGLMVGNLIKAVTDKLGIKQCMQCRGRQRKFNLKGLELQKKWLG